MTTATNIIRRGGSFQYNFCYCSMPLIPLFIKGHLRFNTAFVIVLSAPEFAQNELLTLFQYSFCYCSIYLLIGVKILVKVSIQLLLLFYIFCRGWYAIFIRVSIQLLLLFYYATFNDYEWDNGFQYNFCYCSIYHPFLMQVANNCFNTTFVTVLLCNFQGLWMG